MKKVFFFLLMPIYVPAILFLNFTQKWWESLAE
jgi:hypothetical protein